MTPTHGRVKLTLEQVDSNLNYSGPDRVISSQEYWEEESQKPVSEENYKCGIVGLDTLTEGFETGEVWVLSGPSKHGKTTLAETMGRNFSSQGKNCLWFSFEMTYRKFMAKYKDPSTPQIYIPRERVANDLPWIERKIREAQVKYGTTFVFLDHLHYIVRMEELAKNPSLYIGKAMRYLKTEIALKYNVCVFLISHLTKVKFTEEPNESDIRDSSFITQEADGTMMIYRRLREGKGWTDDDPFSNKAKLVVCNARRTGVLHGKVDMIKLGDNLVEDERIGAF